MKQYMVNFAIWSEERKHMKEDCRNCKEWESCPCGKKGHENNTSIGYSIGECKKYKPKLR